MIVILLKYHFNHHNITKNCGKAVYHNVLFVLILERGQSETPGEDQERESTGTLTWNAAFHLAWDFPVLRALIALPAPLTRATDPR